MATSPLSGASSTAPAGRAGSNGADPHQPHAVELRDFLASATGPLGLSPPEVERGLQEHGKNRLPEPPKKSALVRLFAQLANPLVLTLLVAATIAVVVGAMAPGDESWLARYGDATAILLIVVLNALLGFYQERRAESALEALQKLSAPTARVRRGGSTQVISADDLVPGDVLDLEAGDAVAADARLVQTIDLATEEAALTGESVAVQKDAAAIVPADAPIGDRFTMVFVGTTVTRGKGRAVVTATGPRTELGRIGQMIAGVGEQRTPLEDRLDRFGKQILVVCLALSAALFAWGLRSRGASDLPVLLLEAVSLAVAAIPEGLPAITTITLALGMQRMAKHGAIVRKLPAVETLGAATLIASDKTGTLTQNEMMVRSVWAGEHKYTITGEGYDPRGAIVTASGDEVGDPPRPLRYLLQTIALCNNAELSRDPATGRFKVVGDPTEGALLTLAAKGEHTRESLLGAHTVVTELPFDSDRKRMTVVTRDAKGREIAYVKGSVDVLLPRCARFAHADGSRPLDDDTRARILAEADELSGSALRVLAICSRVLHEGTADGDLERELKFLGLVGMMDPPRPNVRAAVETCAAAGIRAVMITGDHKLTATAIAREIGLWSEGDRALTGTELAALSDEQLAREIPNVRVFARTTAEQKLRIVRAFKKNGHVVAMTGDGVNDAPALREAHIGVAMGRGGTDVARQAADLVLADDNFATIVEAVREGRAIYRNIQKFIFFLLSSNAGLIVAVFVVSFFGSWKPLTPLQILWINLVTNGAPALALGIDPPDPNLMREPPRPTNEGLLSTRDYLGMVFVGSLMGGLAVTLYALGGSGPASAPDQARALAFSLLALAPLAHAWSCRSPVQSAFAARPLLPRPLVAAVGVSALVHLSAVLVPALQPVFRTFPLSLADAGVLAAMALGVVFAVEAAKVGYRWSRPAERSG